MKKDGKKLCVLTGLLLLGSVIYIVVYHAALAEITMRTYEMKYMFLYGFIARPLAYLSATVLAGAGVQQWAGKSIAEGLRKWSGIGGTILLLVYVGMLIALFFGTGPVKLLQSALAYQLVFIIPGLLLSVGLVHDKPLAGAEESI